MHLCYMSFALLLFLSANSIYGQEISRDLVTPVNDPFAETVKPVLFLESGQLVLKVTNGFRDSVWLTQVELRQPASVPRKIVKGPVEVRPAETKYIRLDPSIVLGDKVGMVLQLSPMPPKQKSEFEFRVVRGTNGLVEVEEKHDP